MIRNENPKFFLSSFQKTITMQMNPAMAIQYFIAVQNLEGVGKELYASTEKIKTQLFHMQMIPELERQQKLYKDNLDERGTVDETSEPARGLLDVGTSPGDALPVEGEVGILE